MKLPFRPTESGLKLRVRVQPKAAQDAVAGLVEDDAGDVRLRVRVRVAAEKGAANAAVCTLLARKLAVPKSAVSVTAGRTSRNKTLMVSGDPEALEAALDRLLKGEKG